jgi:peptidyl-prolyl cis-trans isomerase B (cyclophilin B)
MPRKLSQGVGALVATLALSLGIGCGAAPDEAPVTPAAAPADFVWPTGPSPRVTLHIADQGDIVIELYPQLAPKTVEHFLELAESGFYDGTTFHRVMPGFMIQGGDPLSRDGDPANDGMGEADERIDDEIGQAPHLRGVVSMANKGRANTASCQFFVVHQDTPHLDGSYTVFGRVIEGIDVVDAIAAVETDEFGRWGTANRPLENVEIRAITISSPGATAAARDTAPTAS